MELFQFDGDPCKWLDFIQDFRTHVHKKNNFTDFIQMELLLSVFDQKVKHSIISMGRNGIFYSLLQNFGNPNISEIKTSFRSSPNLIIQVYG